MLKPMRHVEKPVSAYDAEDFERATKNAKTLVRLFHQDRGLIKSSPRREKDETHAVTILRISNMLDGVVEALSILARTAYECEGVDHTLKLSAIDTCIGHLNEILETIDTYIEREQQMERPNNRNWSKTHGFMNAMNTSAAALQQTRHYKRLLQKGLK